MPTKKTDWWPYGGILGDVQLISTPRTFIQNANLQLSDISSNEIKLSVHLNEPESKKVNLSIPELGIDLDFVSDQEGLINQKISLDELILWDVDYQNSMMWLLVPIVMSSPTELDLGKLR